MNIITLGLRGLLVTLGFLSSVPRTLRGGTVCLTLVNPTVTMTMAANSVGMTLGTASLEMTMTAEEC